MEPLPGISPWNQGLKSRLFHLYPRDVLFLWLLPLQDRSGSIAPGSHAFGAFLPLRVSAAPWDTCCLRPAAPCGPGWSGSLWCPRCRPGVPAGSSLDPPAAFTATPLLCAERPPVRLLRTAPWCPASCLRLSLSSSPSSIVSSCRALLGLCAWPSCLPKVPEP